jgi:O-antigen ligase
MAYTGTLPPKATRQPASGVASRRASFSSAVSEAGGEGAVAYYLLLVFTFILLGRPQDFIVAIRPIPIAMIVGLACFAFYLLSLLGGKVKFRKSKELNLVLALTAWFILGMPFAYWRSNSVDMFRNEWIKTVLIFFLLTQTVTTLTRVRHLLWVIFISGFVATGLSLMLGGGLMQNEDARFYGLTRGFFSGNYLGIAAAVTLPYMAAMLVHTRSIFKQLLLAASFGTMIYLAVLTASRGNILSIVLSLLLVWYMVLRNNFKAQVIGVCFALVLVVSVAFAPRAFWDRVGTLWQTESYATTTAGNSANDSESQRKALLMRSLYVTATRPILGLGLGNFPIYSGTTTRNAQEWKGTHNTFTQISSEAGLPALVMFLALLFSVIGTMRRMVRITKGKPELDQYRALANATTVSIRAFMLGGFFAHLAYEYYLYYLAGISLGLRTAFTTETGISLDPLVRGATKQISNGGLRRKETREATA